MKHAFINLEEGITKLIPWVWDFLKWCVHLLFIESFTDLWEIAKIRWNKANTLWKKWAVIITSTFIILFLSYWVYELYNDWQNWRTKEWREKILISESHKEIETFFKTYNQKFLAHDCSFMREVWADESMHDKWGHDKYDNYKCEEFVRYQTKMIIPIKIEPIEQNGQKLRARWEAITITQNQWEPLGVKAMYFDLWKINTWDLWHFNNPKSWPRLIEMEINN